MQRQRDERGRFLRGNTVSVGNRGNHYAKYGNANAKKHGMHSKLLFAQQIVDNELILHAIHRGVSIRFYAGEWINEGDSFIILGEKGELAKELLGMQFKRVKIKKHESK